MKKYGQAEFMIYLIEQFMKKNCSCLTKEQEEKIIRESCEQVLKKYPSAKELEFAV